MRASRFVSNSSLCHLILYRLSTGSREAIQYQLQRKSQFVYYAVHVIPSSVFPSDGVMRFHFRSCWVCCNRFCFHNFTQEVNSKIIGCFFCLPQGFQTCTEMSCSRDESKSSASRATKLLKLDPVRQTHALQLVSTVCCRRWGPSANDSFLWWSIGFTYSDT